MALWRFHSYVRPSDSDPIEEWYNGLGKRSKARFHNTMKHLKDMRVWRMPHAKNLGGGIWEIRFKKDDIQHRPLGFFGPSSGQFTFLLGAEERGGEFDPKDALDRAKRRKREIESGRSQFHECPILQ